jgi:hypothetical protein
MVSDFIRSKNLWFLLSRFQKNVHLAGRKIFDLPEA